MKRSLLAVLVPLVVTVGEASAQTQTPTPLPRAMGAPAVSPYLNLARPGYPGVNYYDLVRPQIQADAFMQQQLALQSGAAQNGTNTLDPNAPLATTGTTVRFMSQSSYFGTIRPVPVAPLPTNGLAGGQRTTR